MSEDNSLRWEPESLVPVEELEERVRIYTSGRGGVTIFRGGTLLFVFSNGDAIGEARLLMDEARRILSFHVVPMKDGGYLVGFNKAVAVYVSQEEFRSRQAEIERRIGDLVFPGEKFEMAVNADMGHALIGVYARGKLHRDARLFDFYKRV